MPRLLPGPRTTVLQESITGKNLIDLAVYEPDMMSTVMSLHYDVAPFLSILDFKGYKTQGVRMGANALIDGRFTTVSTNHVQYRIEADEWRIERIRPNAAGVTYEDMANPTYPGLGKLAFYIYMDSNYAGGNEIILLGDGRTQLYVVDKTGGEEVSGGVWRYKVKIDGNNLDEYVDPVLLSDGAECQVVSSKYRQDFSTGGNEKHFFGGFGDAYLTLQRFKYSYSGTAEAMDKNKHVAGRFVYSTGNYKNGAFLKEADDRMMKQVAKYADFQLLEGKGTVDYTSRKVVLTDGDHQEVLSGSGVMYQGDGAIEFPQNNGWNKKWIESFVRDVSTYARPGTNGNKEVMLLLPQKSYYSFQTAMMEFGVTQDANIIGEGNEKIVNNTYKGYTLGGTTLIAVESDALSRRPGITLKDGTKSNDWDAIALPLGISNTGTNMVELIQLRSMVRGTVAGINKGGQISHDIDGTSEHALIQIGVISMTQPIRIYRPYSGNTL